MADPQQAKAYAWESSFRGFNENNVPRRKLRQLIRRAERAYRVNPVKIQFRERVRRAKRYAKIASAYDPEEHSITLGFKDQNYGIALHEAAHAITDSILGYEFPAHGAHWLGIYLWLLEWAKVAPREALHASAKAYGLKWSPPGKIGPRTIRKHYRGIIERAAASRG